MMFPGYLSPDISPKRSVGVVMSKFFLGCDVSKGYCDFVLLDSRRKQVGTCENQSYQVHFFLAGLKDFFGIANHSITSRE